MRGETAAAPGHVRRDSQTTGVLPEIAARAEATIAIRHDLHRHPELAFEEHRTSARVAELLQQWGYEVTTGLGGTGVTCQIGTGVASAPAHT